MYLFHSANLRNVFGNKKYFEIFFILRNILSLHNINNTQRMDFATITKEGFIEENKKIILYDYNGVGYLSLQDVKKLLGLQRTFIYQLIKEKRLKYEDYGSSRFITVDSVWREIEEKGKKQRKEIMKEKLLNLASETHDKIAEELLKGLDPEQIKQAVSKLLSEAQLKEVIKSKKDSK